MICYGLGDLASQFVWTFVGSYLTIFYTDIVGFAPIVVSGIMLIARVWDAVNDPMMGAIAENTCSKFGRFRPYIAFGCPFLAIFAVMTEDPKQRNLIGVSRSVGMNLGMIIVNSCSAGIALHFSGSGAEVATGHGYMMTAIVYSIIAIPLFLIVFFTSKEVIMPEQEARKLNPKETLSGMVKNKYLMVIFIVSTIQMVAFMGRISITTYYVIYCLGAFTLIALIMTIPSIGGIIGSLIVAAVMVMVLWDKTDIDFDDIRADIKNVMHMNKRK